MSSPYVGEIRMFGGSFAPAGWAMCDGALVPISENDTLFNLIGTTYGGDGQETFALPNLQSRLPIHVGNGLQLGETGGTESETLTVNQIPIHNHPPLCRTDNGGSTTPTGSVSASFPDATFYAPPPAVGDPPLPNMGTGSLSISGGSQPHENMMPYTVVTFIISLFGIFPTQT
jgi:microcystin-dependent protein